MRVSRGRVPGYEYGPDTFDCSTCSTARRRLGRRCPKTAGLSDHELETRAKMLEEIRQRQGESALPDADHPGACPWLKVEQQPRLLSLLTDYADLTSWGAWPHSPRDKSKQDAGWLRAMRIIRSENSTIDREERED